MWIPTVIEVNPAICSGKPVIGGTRIMVHKIHGMIAVGYSIEKILACSPAIAIRQSSSQPVAVINPRGHPRADAALMPVNRAADQYPMDPREFTNPVAFYRLFLDVVENPAHDEELKLLWGESTKYTAYVTNTIYPALAKKSGLRNHDKPYWTIDCILYNERDETHFPNATYAKKVYVAMEHENAWSTSTSEMNKLQLLNVPLRVLITYPNSPKQQQTLIGKYNKIIQNAHELFDETDSIRRTLVIFGHKEPIANEIKWKGYHYANGELQPLTPQTTGQNTPASAPA